MSTMLATLLLNVSNPGTLNDFLTALDEGDLKPDVVKLFEEMVAQVQQSAKATATARSDAERFAGEAENSARHQAHRGTNQSMPPNVPAFIIMPHHQLQPARKMQQMLHSGMKTAPLNTPDRLKPARMQVQATRRKRNSTGMRRSKIVDDLNATNASTTERRPGATV